MIYVNNIFALPLVLLAGCLDAFILLAGLRLILGQLSTTRNSKICLALTELSDPVRLLVDRRMSGWTHRQPPRWAAWLVVFGTVLLVRHCLMRLIVLLA
jgi:hypothetical protein